MKEREDQDKGTLTRQRILDAALRLFRRKGFERTTMRDIAAEAEMSLGAAYHYFRSKEELLLAYYEWMQSEHERRLSLAPDTDFRARLVGMLRTKLDLLRKDRRLLAALFRDLADPASPRSVFHRKMRSLRDRSSAEFVALCRDLPLPHSLQEAAGQVLWLSHLGLFLFFIHDRSAQQQRTEKLVELVGDLAALVPALLLMPGAEGLRDRLLAFFVSDSVPPEATS